jgi:predicted cation transporter
LSTIFVIWFVATTTDAIGAILAAWTLYRMKSRFSYYMAFLLIGIAVEAVIAATSLALLWPNELQVNPQFALCRVVGRSVKAIGVWMWALYLLGFLNGARNKPRDEVV